MVGARQGTWLSRLEICRLVSLPKLYEKVFLSMVRTLERSVRPFVDQVANFFRLEGPVQLVRKNLGNGPLFMPPLVVFQGAQTAVDGFEQEGLATAAPRR